MRLIVERFVIDAALVVKAFVMVVVDLLDTIINAVIAALSNDWVKLFTVYFILLMIICFL